MSEVRALIDRLVAAGLDPVDAAEIITRAAIAGVSESQRSAGAVRQERYRRRLDVSLEEWEALRSAVFERDGFQCVYCGSDVSDDPQCDHVFPLALGGKSDLENLATACKCCNSSKRDAPVSEWRRRWN